MGIRTPLGEKINRLRRGKGYTLEALAKLTDSSKSYIWELENRPEGKPSADKIARLARALDVTPDYLLDPSPDSPSEEVAEKAFFRNFRSMDPNDRAKIMAIVRDWSSKK